MYGTVARLRALPGKEQELRGVSEDWAREQGPRVDGFMHEFLFRLDQGGDNYVLVAVFRDQASYRKNAEDPEQDRWYRRIRACLQADPEWQDGDVVYAGYGAKPGA